MLGFKDFLRKLFMMISSAYNKSADDKCFFDVSETDDFGKLLSIVLGDKKKAERLIEYEKSKAPEADRKTCVKNAINRIQNDLRR